MGERLNFHSLPTASRRPSSIRQSPYARHIISQPDRPVCQVSMARKEHRLMLTATSYRRGEYHTKSNTVEILGLDRQRTVARRDRQKC